MSHTIARLLRTLTLASAFALLATACSSGGSTATDASVQGAGSSTVTINFGDQEQEFETLLTDSGVLKGADYKVNFVEFDSGPLVDAGFAAHRIVTDYYVDVEHQTPAVAKIILAAGGITNYVPISSAVKAALQQVVALMASAGAGSDYSVAPLYSTAAEARFAAILKEVPQNG